MSIFGNILNKIFHHGAQASAQSGAPTSPAAPAASTPAPSTPMASNPASAPSASAPPKTATVAQSVDVEAVLSTMAQGHDGGGNWRTSIVDLLKLLDLDSSLTARNELANELNVHVGGDGTAEENIALHRAVMNKLAENGGQVPDSLKH